MHNKLSRRRFLQLSGSSTLLAANGLTFTGSHAAGFKKLGVALVGLGYYSRDLLAPALELTEHCELRGIVTGSPDKIPVWRDKYNIKAGNIYDYDNMHELANNPDIDVVYIVLPTSLHKKYAVIAANAGKHVWCEKPMALSVSDCQTIINACNKNQVQLTVGYRLHHEPNTQTIMNYADSKPYGEISSLIAQAGYQAGDMSPDNWRLKRNMGGGAAYDMGVYPLNAARNAVGAEPIAVTARHEIYRPEMFTEVDESTFFTLEFASGVLAECATSVGKNMNTLKATCAEGWYQLTPFQSYTGVHGITSDNVLLNKRINNQQATQMDNDAAAILTNSAPLVPGEEGLKDIRVMEAIFESAVNGGKRVEI